ncbi:protein PLASTID REDOX INSENSITIVE 2, chloroplastic-like isoform X1 [Ipomoea triloba]|uniref:protein PLASTID REDOX INSENSITIVE 2, chloroplastic-like isoform X1 n=1 Tax=Ipomoea triloba TaxID=35885 RepID=UPI00125D156D|nr:protein PLASTID REDOX INSENSITIVE 2, chloroplastic-like isoform X1 [Ipomoea triloba]
MVVLPAKIPWRSRPILRTPSLIVRTSKSITAARRFISTPLGAAPPRKYVYPDPIPEFAAAETEKFKSELSNRLWKENETFSSRNELDAVVSVCAEVKIFSKFLHDEYGGPGTLLVEPFTDMFVALKGRKLPGASLAARASLLWAQKYVDQDWEIWNSKHPT